MTDDLVARIEAFIMDEQNGLGDNPDAEALFREAIEEIRRLTAQTEGQR